jgi:subtilisin
MRTNIIGILLGRIKLPAILYVIIIIIFIVSNVSAEGNKNGTKWTTSSKIIDNPNKFSILDKGNQDVIIGFNNISEEDAINRVHKRGGSVKRVLGHIRAISSKLSTIEIEKLKKDPDIKYIEPDAKGYITYQSVPWGVTRINATPVHSIYKGAGVLVAVIDTGIDQLHPDLFNNYNGGFDYVNEDSDPADDNGHGTHVSGIIAAEDNDIGVIGVAPEAKINAMKAFDSNGIGSLSDIIPALYDSADNRVDIISMSWTINGDYQSLHDAINYSYDRGIILVAAAGNGYGSAIG